MNLKSALKALGAANADLPEAALRWALDNWDVAGGALMQTLARCAKELENTSDADVNIALFGLHLMAQKRETRAFPLVCALAKSPEGLPAILGDTMFWSGASILISLFDGDARWLQEMIKAPMIDPLMTACAFDAMAYLTATGKISRDETHALLKKLRENADVYPDCDFLPDSWATSVALLGFDDLMPLIRGGFARDGIDAAGIDLSDFDNLRNISREDATGLLGFEREGIQPLDDAIAMLRRIEIEAAEADLEDDDAGGITGQPDEIATPASTENQFRNVGRNDPCPCGSGKKYKKCCLAA